MEDLIPVAVRACERDLEARAVLRDALLERGWFHPSILHIASGIVKMILTRPRTPGMTNEELLFDRIVVPNTPIYSETDVDDFLAFLRGEDWPVLHFHDIPEAMMWKAILACMLFGEWSEVRWPLLSKMRRADDALVYARMEEMNAGMFTRETVDDDGRRTSMRTFYNPPEMRPSAKMTAKRRRR